MTKFRVINSNFLQNFFESLDPLRGYETKEAFERYLYERSCEIEPKDCDKLPNFVSFMLKTFIDLVS